METLHPFRGVAKATIPGLIRNTRMPACCRLLSVHFERPGKPDAAVEMAAAFHRFILPR
jgi:hypothetical protein